MKEDDMGRACRTHERSEKCMEDFGGISEGKKQLERHMRKWNNNIKMN
jgi:hypothetical protein